MLPHLVDVFEQTRDGYSSDRVLCDPDLNARFIAACRREGLLESESELNRMLLNIRKSGRLGQGGTKKQSRFKDDEYRFAAEIAARHLERRESCSLDQILINPVLVAEFDSLCQELSPGFAVVQYRLSAMGLRKKRKLRPEVMSHALPSKTVKRLLCSTVNVSDLPTSAGLYIFFDNLRTLYVGEAANLKMRLKKHLEHSDNKQLARWFWENSPEKVWLEVHLVEEACSTRTRRALEFELITSRRPVFNIVGAGSDADE